MVVCVQRHIRLLSSKRRRQQQPLLLSPFLLLFSQSSYSISSTQFHIVPFILTASHLRKHRAINEKDKRADAEWSLTVLLVTHRRTPFPRVEVEIRLERSNQNNCHDLLETKCLYRNGHAVRWQLHVKQESRSRPSPVFFVLCFVLTIATVKSSAWIIDSPFINWIA